MKKHKVYLQELSAEFSEADYSKFYEVVMRRIENGELVPMKSAKNNGRKPALPLCFWEYEKEADHTELYEELKYRYHPRINTRTSGMLREGQGEAAAFERLSKGSFGAFVGSGNNE